jgi:hypothetical protein
MAMCTAKAVSMAKAVTTTDSGAAPLATLSGPCQVFEGASARRLSS